MSLHCLPLKSRQIRRQNRHNPLKSRNPLLHLRLRLRHILTAQLLVEIITVRARLHRNPKDPLHHKVVVLLQRLTVCIGERCRELLGLVVEVLAERFGGELEAAGGVTLVCVVRRGKAREGYRLSQRRPSLAMCEPEAISD